MHIKIHNYEMLNFVTENFVVSTKGISRITSEPMLNALKDMHMSTPLLMTQEDLDEKLYSYGMDAEKAGDFLRSVVLISPVAYAPRIDRVILSMDWGSDIDVKSIINAELNFEIEWCALEALAELAVDVRRPIVVISMAILDFSKLKKIYFETASKFNDCVIVVATIVDGDFLVSQPYLPSVGSPCFFCEIDRALHYEKGTKSSSSWMNLLSFCSDREIPMPNFKMSLLDQALSLALIVERIKFFVGSPDFPSLQDDILYATKINMGSGGAIKYQVPHWAMCECLRRQS